jgi:hypothetical protein
LDAQTVTDDVLRRLGRSLPASGGLCWLDLVVRRLYSLALDPLVSSGEVPCVDRDSALASLRQRPLETFDFHHPGAITAHWVRDHFTALGPRLALELANQTGVPARAAGFWVEALFHFAVSPVDQPGRVEALALTAYHTGGNAGLGMERLAALLALLARLTRVVLVADDLEGFAADGEAGLRLAALLAGLRHAAERVDVVLSVNQDIWESAFLPRLSGGLMDRLTETVIDLEPLAADESVALIESRMPGFGAKVLAALGAEGLPGHARGVLKSASEIWQVMAHAGETAPPRPPSTGVPMVAAAAAITPATAITLAAEPAPTPVEPPLPEDAAVPAPSKAIVEETVPTPADSPGSAPPAVEREPAAAGSFADFASPGFGSLPERFAAPGEPAIGSPEAAESSPPADQPAAESSQVAPEAEPAPAAVPPVTVTGLPPAWQPPALHEVMSRDEPPAPPESALPQVPGAEAPPSEAPPMFGASPAWDVIKPEAEPQPPPLMGRLVPEPEAEAEPTPPPTPPPPPPAAEQWHEAVAPTTPFSEPHPEPRDGGVQPPPLPATPEVSPAPPPPPAEPPVDQDRIEQLLRQFRERYNRPGS